MPLLNKYKSAVLEALRSYNLAASQAPQSFDSAVSQALWSFDSVVFEAPLNHLKRTITKPKKEKIQNGSRASLLGPGGAS